MGEGLSVGTMLGLNSPASRSLSLYSLPLLLPTDMHVRLTSDSKLCSGVNVAMQPGSLSSTYPDFHPIMAGLGHSWYFSVVQMSRVALETLNLLLFLQLREQSHNIKFHEWKTSISLSM